MSVSSTSNLTTPFDPQNYEQMISLLKSFLEEVATWPGGYASLHVYLKEDLMTRTPAQIHNALSDPDSSFWHQLPAILLAGQLGQEPSFLDCFSKYIVVPTNYNRLQELLRYHLRHLLEGTLKEQPQQLRELESLLVGADDVNFWSESITGQQMRRVKSILDIVMPLFTQEEQPYKQDFNFLCMIRPLLLQDMYANTQDMCRSIDAAANQPIDIKQMMETVCLRLIQNRGQFSSGKIDGVLGAINSKLGDVLSKIELPQNPTVADISELMSKLTTGSGGDDNKQEPQIDLSSIVESAMEAIGSSPELFNVLDGLVPKEMLEQGMSQLPNMFSDVMNHIKQNPEELHKYKDEAMQQLGPMLQGLMPMINSMGFGDDVTGGVIPDMKME